MVKIMDDFQIEDGVLVKYTGTDSDVVIPEGVTAIGDQVFFFFRTITNITIPSSVKSIGNTAFAGCESLTSVTIPGSVTSIGDTAFGGCQSLTDVTVSDGVKSIGDRAFGACHSLTEITLPDSVKYIGNEAFKDCKSLATIMLPDGVNSIGDEAFEDCKFLANITIPDSVTIIGYSAFEGCDSLEKIFISAEKISLIRDGDETVVRAAFWGCLTAYAKKSANKVEREGFSEFVKMYLEMLGNLIIDNVENINSIIHAKLITVETAEELLEQCTTAECREVLLDYINANIGDGDSFNKFNL